MQAHIENELRDALHRVWGFSDFRPLQREAMGAVLQRRDSVVVLPTGGGKSLCFQAPALVTVRGAARPESSDGDSALPATSPVAASSASDGRRGFALVVSPLISLMKDQVDGLRVDGVEAAYLNSTQDQPSRDKVLASLREDRCRLLYVSPERLVGDGSDAFRRLLRQSTPRFVAIDEAHCISQWGHDFRPEYRQLGRLRDDFPGVSLHAFTATATERVRRDIVAELRLHDPLVLVGSFDRPNLTYRVVGREHLHTQILSVLARHEDEAGIIYCTSRREVEALAEWLHGTGRRALPYHAGLPDAVRARHQDAFLDERADIVVATVAFGMGIDRSNVRFVIHAGSPRSPEHYQQESGRAGRDGLPAECVLIYSGSDFTRWRQLLESNGELTEAARALLRDMERYATGARCRHRTLVEYFGQAWTHGPCGACDWCLRELEPVAESATVARKILSCVARVRQSWGLGHVTDVLVGKSTERAQSAGHTALSTFGLLNDESPSAVRGYLEQLIGKGLLVREGDPYPILRLTAPGAAWLKGLKGGERTSDYDGEMVLYRAAPPMRKRTGRARRPLVASGGRPGLFDALREARLKLARERGVPPYVIFHDTTLREMAERRPATLAELHDIYGVGTRKAADFGEVFLDLIRTFRRPEL